MTARETYTNFLHTISSDREGRFRFAYLVLGKYEVKVQRNGFAEAVRTITLTVGAAFDLPIILAVASDSTSMTVTSEAAVLETNRSQVAGTVSTEEVDNLPLNGRNFVDLALLVPGVSPTNTASTQLFQKPRQYPGKEFRWEASGTFPTASSWTDSLPTMTRRG